MLGYDNGGIIYYTKHKDGEAWWPEELLKKYAEEMPQYNVKDAYAYTASITSD